MADTELREIPFETADGGTQTLDGLGAPVVLVVNVASRCGLAPQYETLERMQETYRDRGFTVVGFPSNQFLQELKTMDAILEYCSTTWGISFPIMAKVKVNGGSAAPVYKALKDAPNPEGLSGRITWNFEKFVVTPDGVHRFSPRTLPDDPAVIAAIEGALGG